MSFKILTERQWWLPKIFLGVYDLIYLRIFFKALKRYQNYLINDVSDNIFRNVTSGGRLRGPSGFIKCLLKSYQKGKSSNEK
jgi:hypothetical protein